MNKKIIISGIAGSLILVGVGILLLSGSPEHVKIQKENDNLKQLLKNKNLADEISGVTEVPVENEEKPEKELSKEEELKKRYSLRSFIIKGDYYLENNQPQKALQKYLIAYKKSPNDEKIMLKIAELYFDIGRYDNAYKFFYKVKNYEKTNMDKLMLSLIYSLDIDDKEEIGERARVIDKEINIPKKDKIYYLTNMQCLVDFHLCKKNFQKYIAQEEKEPLSPGLENIKKAIQKYEDFQIGELYFKDTLIANAIMNNNLYPISAKIAEEVLEKKVNYGTAMQIAGKSYYEYGEYEKARDILTDYYELEPGNAKVAYMLGVIFSKLEDYESSSLYYNAAIKNGYGDKIDLERRLAYNYYLLSNTEAMLSTFGYLIKEKEANENDFYLAIYNAIVNKDNERSISWAKAGLRRYPKEETFYGYLGWIYREIGDSKRAEEYLKKGYKMDIRNPLITLNLGYLYEKLEEYKRAKIYFERTVAINSDGEFGSLAKKELTIIKKIIENEEKLAKVKSEIDK